MKKVLRNFNLLITIIVIILLFGITGLSVWEYKELGNKHVTQVFYWSYQNLNQTEKMLSAHVFEYDNNQIYDDFVNNENNIKQDILFDIKGDYPENWLKNFNKEILNLQKEFPNGMYWNHKDLDFDNNETQYGDITEISKTHVTNIPCNHGIEGETYCNIYNGISTQVLRFYIWNTMCRFFKHVK